MGKRLESQPVPLSGESLLAVDTEFETCFYPPIGQLPFDGENGIVSMTEEEVDARIKMHMGDRPVVSPYITSQKRFPWGNDATRLKAKQLILAYLEGIRTVSEPIEDSYGKDTGDNLVHDSIRVWLSKCCSTDAKKRANEVRRVLAREAYVLSAESRVPEVHNLLRDIRSALRGVYTEDTPLEVADLLNLHALPRHTSINSTLGRETKEWVIGDVLRLYLLMITGLSMNDVADRMGTTRDMCASQASRMLSPLAKTLLDKKRVSLR